MFVIRSHTRTRVVQGCWWGSTRPSRRWRAPSAITAHMWRGSANRWAGSPAYSLIPVHNPVFANAAHCLSWLLRCNIDTRPSGPVMWRQPVRASWCRTMDSCLGTGTRAWSCVIFDSKVANCMCVQEGTPLSFSFTYLTPIPLGFPPTCCCRLLVQLVRGAAMLASLQAHAGRLLYVQDHLVGGCCNPGPVECPAATAAAAAAARAHSRVNATLAFVLLLLLLLR